MADAPPNGDRRWADDPLTQLCSLSPPRLFRRPVPRCPPQARLSPRPPPGFCERVRGAAVLPTYTHVARAPTAELRMTALADTGVLNPSNGWRTCGAIAVNGWQMLGAEDIMAAVAAKDAAVKANAEADETAEAITEAELKESSTDKDLNGADYKAINKFVYLPSQQPGTRSSQNTKPKAVTFLAALSPPWRERIAPARAASTAALAAATSALAAAESGLAVARATGPPTAGAAAAAAPAAAAAAPAAAAPAAAPGGGGGSPLDLSAASPAAPPVNIPAFLLSLTAEERRAMRAELIRSEGTDDH